MAHQPQSDHLDRIRHTLSHLLASAVVERFPTAKPAIGPTIEHGFYYDFDVSQPFKPQDLPKLEKRIKELVRQNLTMEKLPTANLEQAGSQLSNNPYKRELYHELKRQNANITFYKIGNFTDLCKGGHVENTRQINPDAFKLTKIAGAYWRGDSSKPMLQRIYGVAFATKPELDQHLKMLEEAEARDHRKLGQELDLFSFDGVAPGAVFWHPNGMVVWNELEKLLRDYLVPVGYQEVQTPLMVKPELFQRSGHLKHYRANMFRVEGQGEEFYLKPMNCPESAVIFASKTHSYRDLPVRLAEIGRIHRNELSGTLGGLFRVRQITQDDCHIYCRPDQLEREITSILKLSKFIYKIFGLTPSFFLSTKPDNAMGDPQRWKEAEAALAQALRANKLEFKEKPKDGTFYAPKIDIDVTDSLGRKWQLCTIQADLVMVPSLPGVEYTDEKGHKQQPVVIHRAIFGSFERFIGILLEHLAGRLPTWLAPVQVAIVPVGSRHVKPSAKLAKTLRASGIRVNVDDANETVGYKIRKAEKMKVPYMLVIGDKET
ncbi:MAG: threonine--tRNA ligase, partial [Candidatus Kerfeldbacteria bacterium]|nr:threonine--tRNA ligase [Candidatus Kerfeldbacteria bacterium]